MTLRRGGEYAGRRAVQSSRRADHQVQVLVVPLDQPTDPFQGWSESISGDGLFVRSSTLLPAESGCLLKIIREDHPTGKELWARAKVVHYLPGAGFGCKLTQLAPQMRTLLERWLDETPVGVPLIRPFGRHRRNTDQI